ncbi:unnamed protein product [Linum trigynum]|uniref:Uncharacterized protein n=1 Tax=Linum trigynum TaxID=586398 RepID=A0AAV2C939_9ROSI
MLPHSFFLVAPSNRISKPPNGLEGGGWWQQYDAGSDVAVGVSWWPTAIPPLGTGIDEKELEGGIGYGHRLTNITPSVAARQ